MRLLSLDEDCLFINHCKFEFFNFFKNNGNGIDKFNINVL